MSRSVQFVAGIALLLVAFAALRYSENGRYRYTDGLLVDTRNGEAWPLDGNAHYEPRAAVVTAHHIQVKDSTALETCMDGKSRDWVLHPIAMRICRSYANEIARLTKDFPHWTGSNIEKYFQCLPGSLRAWKNEASAKQGCEIAEEHDYWIQTHPEAANQPEDKEAFHACLQRNDAPINGPPQQFHLVYDECMQEAYHSAPGISDQTFDFQPDPSSSATSPK